MNMCEKRALYNTESSTAPSSFSLHFRGTNAHKSTQTGRETDRQTDRQTDRESNECRQTKKHRGYTEETNTEQ